MSTGIIILFILGFIVWSMYIGGSVGYKVGNAASEKMFGRFNEYIQRKHKELDEKEAKKNNL